MINEQRIFNILSELEAHLFYAVDEESQNQGYIEAHKKVDELLKLWHDITGCINE